MGTMRFGVKEGARTHEKQDRSPGSTDAFFIGNNSIIWLGELVTHSEHYK
jgi:hypothetical protein